MKIAVIGVTGFLGTLVAKEALERGYEVIGVTPAKYLDNKNKISDVEYRIGDASYLDELTEAIKSADVAISVFPPTIEHPEEYHNQVRNVINACKRADVPRLVAIVGSSVALTNTGKRLVESDYFQETTRHFYLSICDSIDIYEEENELNWSVIIPAAKMLRYMPDKRKSYRIGGKELVTIDQNSMRYYEVSQISYFDFAYAIMDEVENPKHFQERFTVGY